MDDGQTKAGIYGDIEDHNGKVTEPHYGKSLLFCLAIILSRYDFIISIDSY